MQRLTRSCGGHEVQPAICPKSEEFAVSSTASPRAAYRGDDMVRHHPDRRVVATGGVAAATWLSAGPSRAESSVTQISLAHADGRLTTYRLFAPRRPGPWGLVLFSHGANSSNLAYDRLWAPWAARGYLLIGANHIDTGPVELQRNVDRPTLWRSRLADVLLPLAQRAPFDAAATAAGGEIDWARPSFAGHSFGAVVAQALCGAQVVAPGETVARSSPVAHASACIALSPPGPLANFIPGDAWATVAAPALLQTGDADVLPGFVDDWRSRLVGFKGRPDRWSIVGRGVNHYFGGLICRLAPGGERQSPALDETAALCGDFLDAYVRGAETAKARLASRAAKGDDGVVRFDGA